MWADRSDAWVSPAELWGVRMASACAVEALDELGLHLSDPEGEEGVAPSQAM